MYTDCQDHIHHIIVVEEHSVSLDTADVGGGRIDRQARGC